MEVKKRKRGRPSGQIDKVVSPRSFGMDDFAAARAYLMGIDPLTACRKYLLVDDVPKSGLVALRRIGDILARIATIGESRKHGENAETNATNLTAAGRLKAASIACKSQIDRHQAERAARLKQRLEEENKIATSQGLRAMRRGLKLERPAHFQSMAAFESHYDRVKRPDEPLDAIELKAAFEEFLSDWYRSKGYYYRPDYSSSYHEHSEWSRPGSAPDDDERKYLRIPADVAKLAESSLAKLEWTVQRKPNAADLLSSWIGGTTLTHLNKSSIHTLYTLCDLIKARGSSWWKDVPGLGPMRAKRIQDWIGEVKVQGVQMPDNAFDSVQKRWLKEVLLNEARSGALPSLVEFELEPLAPFVMNTDLNGANGLFRRKEPSLLKAETDIDAILVALGKYKDKAQTLKVYAREICRFCLWSYTIQKLPVSSLGVDDARVYREFLANIPGDWISQAPSPPPRNTAAWRPFRGQLDQASQRKALTSVNVILRQLMDGGYLTGNPMAGVLKHAELQRPKMDVSHALSSQHWQFACGVLDQEEAKAAGWVGDGKNMRDPRPSIRRTKALLHLLYSTGIRRDELFKARLGHLERIVVDGEVCHLLEVTGKRSKKRQVMVPRYVMDMVMQHVADRSTGFSDDLATAEGRKKVPLISVIGKPVHAHRKAQFASPSMPIERQITLKERDLASRDGALGADGMKAVLESFFNRCAKSAQHTNLDVETFNNATLHWMRHTFGHTMVDSNVDIRVVQKALGHANINTTALYSKADMEQMVRGIRGGLQQANASAIAIAESVGAKEPAISFTGETIPPAI